jgi:hypothetical protein
VTGLLGHRFTVYWTSLCTTQGPIRVEIIDCVQSETAESAGYKWPRQQHSMGEPEIFKLPCLDECAGLQNHNYAMSPSIVKLFNNVLGQWRSRSTKLWWRKAWQPPFRIRNSGMLCQMQRDVSLHVIQNIFFPVIIIDCLVTLV